MSKYLCVIAVLIIIASISSIFNVARDAHALYQSSTVTIHTSKDVYIYSAYPDKNYNAYSHLTVGQHPSGYYCRALLYFSLASIPADAEIVSAKLVLTLKSIGYFDHNYMHFYIARLTRYWLESSTTWNKRTSSLSWATPGGDHAFNSPVPHFYVYKTDPVNKQYSIDVTVYVKGWKSGAFPNYGLLIKPSSLYQGLVWFYASEYSTAAYRPKLVVTYRLPKIKVFTGVSSKTVVQGQTVQFSMKVDSQLIDTSQGIEIQIVQNLPSNKGFVVSISPMSSHSQTFTALITVATSANTPPGTYYLKLRVVGKSSTSGSTCTSSTLTFKITVKQGGSFNLVFNPASLSINAGESGEADLQVVAVGGFTGSVTLSVAAKPADFTVQILDTTVNAGDATKVRVSVPSTATPGTYSVVIKGTSGSSTVTETLTVTVTEVPFNFNLDVSPKTASVVRGTPVAVTVSTTTLSGSPESIQLSVSGLPAGTPVVFAKNPITSGESTTIRILTDDLSGTYSIAVKGKSTSGVEKTQTFVLTVREKFAFAVKVQPSSVEINQGETATLAVHVNLVKGKARPVTLSLQGLPSGASYTFNPSTLTPPGSSTLTINAGSAKGTFTLIVKATSGEKEEVATFYLTIKEKKCIVATATYGSELSPEVRFLRSFRDGIVLSTYSGQRFYAAFDAFYYSWSPYFAQFMHENPWTKPIMKLVLYPLIGGLHAAAYISLPVISFNPEVGVYIAGALSAFFIAIAYFVPATLLLAYLLRKRVRFRISRRLIIAMLCLVAVFALTSTAAVLARQDALLTLATSGYVLSVIASTTLGVTWFFAKWLGIRWERF